VHPLGPLHNPSEPHGQSAAAGRHAGVPMVAVFDTAWGQTMPKEA
jgi:acetate kinase